MKGAREQGGSALDIGMCGTELLNAVRYIGNLRGTVLSFPVEEDLIHWSIGRHEMGIPVWFLLRLQFVMADIPTSC